MAYSERIATVAQIYDAAPNCPTTPCSRCSRAWPTLGKSRAASSGSQTSSTPTSGPRCRRQIPLLSPQFSEPRGG